MRKAIGLAAVLLLAGPAAAEPFHHPFGEWREYNRDWLAACPDAIVEDAADFYGYSCFASTGSQELNGANLPAYKLTLIRNRLDGALDLAITVSPDSGEYDPERPIVLAFGTKSGPMAREAGPAQSPRIGTGLPNATAVGTKARKPSGAKVIIITWSGRGKMLSG